MAVLVMERKKVLLADRHPATRDGLVPAVRYALPAASIIGVGSLEAAEAALGNTSQFAMALLDPHLPDAQGLTSLLRIQYKMPRSPIVLLLNDGERALVGTARAMGAAGAVSKAAAVDKIAEDLRAIVMGRSVFPPHSIPTSAISIRERLARLSDAQRRVLFALTDGRANKAIAYDLKITEATVKAHLTAIFRQLGVTNRVEAMLALQPLLA